jgi:hypothetical protein
MPVMTGWPTKQARSMIPGDEADQGLGDSGGREQLLEGGLFSSSIDGADPPRKRRRGWLCILSPCT